jgi:hypothetical protein
MRVLFIALVAVLLSASASAREIKVGSLSFQVVAPPGYCEVDETRKPESEWLSSTIKFGADAGHTVFAAFPDSVSG